MPQLFTEKYFPKDFDEFVGNSEVVGAVRQWADGWEKGKKGKPLLFYGSTGTGKTCLALLAARQYKWQLFELNASDFRSKEVIERIAGAAAQSSSLSASHRLVLIDEIDALQAVDRGGAAAITKILKETQNPVILTANNVYSDQKLVPVREACNLLQFKKINYLSIAKRLREICEKEGIPAEEEVVKDFAKGCSGDFRAALLDLQTLAMNGMISKSSLVTVGFRARKENVFRVMEKIFKAKSIEEAREARAQSEISDDLLLRWVEENIPRIFKEKNDTPLAFEQLSRADVFNGRIINRQYYGFLRYSSELMTSGVSLSREHDYHSWLQFQFPTLLKKLSQSSALRSIRTETCKKIGEKMHSSSREIMAELPFLRVLFKNHDYAVNLSAAFELTEKGIAFLAGSKAESAKAKKIFLEAQKLKEKEVASKTKFLRVVEEETMKPANSLKAHEKENKQTRLF